MFEKDPMANQPFPANEEEKKQLVSQVIKFIHSEEVSKAIVSAMQGQSENPMQILSQLAAVSTLKVITGIEEGTGRDIPPEVELGILQMVTEELTTIAVNMGFEASPEKVQNILQIAAGLFNKLQKGAGQPSAMQGPPQGPPQGGMV